MNRQRGPRDIDISRARPAGRRTAQPRQAGGAAVRGGAQRAPVHGRSSGTSVARGAAASRQGAARRPAQGGRNGAAGHSSAPGYGTSARRRRKKNTGKTAAKVLLCIVLVLGLAFGGIYWYVGSIFNTGEMGSLAPPESGADALVPDELSGTMNILVLGIDYSTEDAVKRDPIGQTDMILYVRVNGSDHTMTMLQIPRDTLVGEIGGSAGKINGIFANSADKENRVNTLAQYITKVFGLPIDDYVTIDMDSLREIVDVFGGIEVYVPVTMEYDCSRLEQGWRV